MKRIVIGRGCSISDCRGWRVFRGVDVEIQVLRDARFGLGAEGVGVAALVDLAESGGAISISAPWLRGHEAAAFFRTLFGLTLLSAARRLDGSGPKLARCLDEAWTSVLAARGVLGKGDLRHIIVRQPGPWLPPALRGSPGEFGGRQHFRRLLARELGDIGFFRGFSFSEEAVLTFVFEALSNALEHGKPTLGRVSYCGVSIERLTLPRSFYAHPLVPGFLKEYSDRASSALGYETALFAVSVLDVGRGIQGTLPHLDGESAEGTIRRAFLDGVSSKDPADMKKGFGLRRIMEAGSRLRAYLLVRSLDRVLTLDFSARTTSSPSDFLLDLGLGRDLPCIGTTVTLLFPYIRSGGDQLPLQWEGQPLD